MPTCVFRAALPTGRGPWHFLSLTPLPHVPPLSPGPCLSPGLGQDGGTGTGAAAQWPSAAPRCSLPPCTALHWAGAHVAGGVPSQGAETSMGIGLQGTCLWKPPARSSSPFCLSEDQTRGFRAQADLAHVHPAGSRRPRTPSPCTFTAPVGTAHPPGPKTKRSKSRWRV